jgi:RNA polymerase sigma factor (sigma-70 family)
MGEAMPSSELNDPRTRLHKLKPQAKLPVAAVLHTFALPDVKLLKRLLSEQVEYVAHELLDQLQAGQLLQRPLYQWQDPPRRVAQASRLCHAPPGPNDPASDDSGVYRLSDADDSVWSLDRERYLFLRLNYCRRQVFAILRDHSGRRLSGSVATELLRWERAVMETRGEIVRENLPLVLAMAKRTRITSVDLTDLISDGNLALVRAVNKFDCSRGYRFSTYACRAILKSFSRVATRMSRYRGHFPTEFDPALEKSNHVEEARSAREGDCVHELKSILAENAAQLSEIEQKVILARFALDPGDPDPTRRAKTLEEVGAMIGVTKERVRQIQNKALGKLRTALEQTVLA